MERKSEAGMQGLEKFLGIGVSRLSRVKSVCGENQKLIQVIEKLLGISQVALPAMFLESEQIFAFTRRRKADGSTGLEGKSLRYSVIALLGAVHICDNGQRELFGGKDAVEFCRLLVDRLKTFENLGDIALLVWAAAELKLPEFDVVLDRLRRKGEDGSTLYTVELAWKLAALAAAKQHLGEAVDDEARETMQLLMDCFSSDAGVFRHWVLKGEAPWYRAHVACFADQVYPIQALARYHKVFGDEKALEMASSCAEQICLLQGVQGQWWWHYDVRTGKVVEGYPVYTVHQDSMAPMALLDLKAAGGADFSREIRLGLSWLASPPEVGNVLFEESESLLWRKVDRSGRKKLVRMVRASACRFVSGMRLSFLDRMFPPTTVDYEVRPYHLGWILLSWLGE